jgi:hypothetical protein
MVKYRTKEEVMLLSLARQRRAAYFLCIIQAALIFGNVLVLIFKVGIFAFVLTSLYLFLYINFLKASISFFDNGNKNRFIKIFRVLSPILFTITFSFVCLVGF